MAIAVLTSKGQVTIPKGIRDALKLRTSDKVIFTVEKDYAVLKPARGNILDIGGSIKIPIKEKPIDFHRVRRNVRNSRARNIAGKMK